MEILSERLILREFDGSDLPALLGYQADPRYSAFCGPDEVGAAHTQKLMATFSRWAAERPRRNFQFAIAERRGSGEAIGSSGIRLDQMESDVGDFGVELAPPCWGRGFAAEAAQAVLRFAFRDLHLREVRGVSVTQNARVGRLVERLGFTRVATTMGPDWVQSRGWSCTEWRLTAEQWNQRQTG